MKRYPYWQNVIREAQAADKSVGDNMDDEQAESVRLLMRKLGLPDGKQRGGNRVIDHYEFKQWETSVGEVLSVEHTGWLRTTHHYLNIKIEDSATEEELQQARAEVAYAIDQLDYEYRFAFFRLFVPKYRIDIWERWTRPLRKWLGVY